MRYTSFEKPLTCPACGSASVAEILYGYPHLTDELKAELAAGTTVLGGCCLTGDDPVWRCLACGAIIYHPAWDVYAARYLGPEA